MKKTRRDIVKVPRKALVQVLEENQKVSEGKVGELMERIEKIEELVEELKQKLKAMTP